MGLLEKAGKISEDEKKEEKPAASVAKVEPEQLLPSLRNPRGEHLGNQRSQSQRHQRPPGKNGPNPNPR